VSQDNLIVQPGVQDDSARSILQEVSAIMKRRGCCLGIAINPTTGQPEMVLARVVGNTETAVAIARVIQINPKQFAYADISPEAQAQVVIQ
jgi:hypothetical protein